MAAEFEAMYEEGQIVTSKAYYNDESGRDVAAEKSYVVKEGTTYGEIKQTIEKDLAENLPKIHKDLRFKSWNCRINVRDDAIIYENHWEAEYDAQYENRINRFYVYDSEDIGWEAIYKDDLKAKADAFTHIISEKDEKFIVPTEIGGYTNLKVLNDDTMTPGQEFNTFGSFAWILTGDKTGAEPENPTEPEKPTEPQNSAIELPQDFIDQQVDKLNKGESVHIQMGDATVVPKEMLLAAKGKDVNIILDMDGYTWTINGKDIYAGSEYKGKFGNLYYHDSDGKMNYRNVGKVDANGNVTLGFDHASDYVIVLADKQLSQSDVPSGLQPGSSNNGNDPVKTGDTAPILLFAVIAIISAAIFAYKRKRA